MCLKERVCDVTDKDAGDRQNGKETKRGDTKIELNTLDGEETPTISTVLVWV